MYLDVLLCSQLKAYIETREQARKQAKEQAREQASEQQARELTVRNQLLLCSATRMKNPSRHTLQSTLLLKVDTEFKGVFHYFGYDFAAKSQHNLYANKC